MTDTDKHSEVKDYYGKRLKSSYDLKTNVCLVSKDSMPAEAKEVLKSLHPDITSKSYGCGAVFPECVDGCAILDLGSGAGMDCFMLSKMVGPKGHITGVDMTPEQVEVAKKYTDYHMQQFGYKEANVDFRLGYIESLDQVGLKDNTYDIIIEVTIGSQKTDLLSWFLYTPLADNNEIHNNSNCVINLTPDKTAVLREAYRTLKPGGEVYFSDVYADRPVPEVMRKDPVLWGECLSGALHWKDLMRIATEVGFAPPVLVKSTTFICTNAEIEKLRVTAGGIQFCSATYRLFKPVSPTDLTTPDTLTEVQYKGTIKDHEKNILFSYNVPIPACCPVALPTSVARLLQESRFAPHFTFQPLPEGKEATPVCPGLKEFLEVDPFKVSSGSVDVDPPRPDGGGCCGSQSSGKTCCS